MRGNVETRLRKLDEGEADATILAAAGLARLGLSARAASFLSADEWLPAPGQGAIAITARSGDAATLERLGRIDHRATSVALMAERAFLAVLDGSCRTPIGGLAEIDGDSLRFRGIIVKPDGCDGAQRSSGAAASAMPNGWAPTRGRSSRAPAVPISSRPEDACACW